MTIFKDRTWNMYSVILVGQALYSLHPWFMWSIPNLYANITQFLVAIFYLLAARRLWDFNNSYKLLACFLLFITFFYRALVDGGNLNFYIVNTMSAFTLIPIVLLKPQYQIDLLEKFQKLMTVLLFVSLLFWILHLIGVNLPSTDISYGQVDRGYGAGDEDQYYFANYYFFLVNQTWMLRPLGAIPDFLRFSSVFLEPGYLAILIVFFLYINKFDFKSPRNYIYIAVIIATVSLAGFLMAFLAFGALKIKSIKQGVLGLGLLAVIVFSGAYFFKNYNGGDNFVNQGIIERLEFDESEGTISGYNRTSEDLDVYFAKFIWTSDVITGIGKDGRYGEFADRANVGYKAYIILYGLVGTMFFLIFIYLLARNGRGYLSCVFFLLYVIMFIRGHDDIYVHADVLVYACGLALINLENTSINSERKV